MKSVLVLDQTIAKLITRAYYSKQVYCTSLEVSMFTIHLHGLTERTIQYIIPWASHGQHRLVGGNVESVKTKCILVVKMKSDLYNPE